MAKAVNGRDARAAALLSAYLSLGEGRSIRAAHAILREAGVEITIKTAEAYSKDYHFVARAEEFDRQRTDARIAATLQEAIASDVEQVRLARILTDYGAGVITAKMGEGADLKAENASDAVRAAAEGFRMMRLASGQATEIHHVVTEFYGLVINAIGALWVESLNAAHDVYGADPATRARAHAAASAIYGPGSDRVLQEHLRAIGADITLIAAPEE